MIRGPGPRYFDDQPPRGQFTPESFTVALKRVDCGPGQQERRIPHHLLRPMGENLRQGAKPLPRVGSVLQAGFNAQYRLPDHGVDLPLPLQSLPFPSQIVSTRADR